MGSPHNFPALKSFRRELRTRLTPAEALLWTVLRNSRLEGRKFRRQHSIGAFILDFYCPSARFAIELDGAAHDSAAAEQKDAQRDGYLRGLGIRVARYENRHVVSNLEGVLQDI